jgi:hypothetical protein
MSYTLMAHLIDIPKLKKLVGSKDDLLLTAIKEHSEEFDEEDEEEDDDDDELTLLSALRQLIMGEMLDPNEAHQYGYAIVELCDYLGERLESDAWSGVRWEAIEQCGLESLLTKSGAPVDLPPNDAFPRVGHIRREEVESYLAAARQRSEKTGGGAIGELLEEYIGWLEDAADQGKDVVFFYY